MKRIWMTMMVALTMLPAARAQSASEWRDSLERLNAAIRQDPGSTDLRLKKAAVNIELNQWEYAVEEYGNVLRLDEKNLAALYYRAFANVNLRRYAPAKADYEAFLRLAPLNMEARLGLAVVCEKMGRHTDALDLYNQTVEMFPDSAVAYAARASYETGREQYELALYDWDEAISRAPMNAGYVVSKADILIRLFRKDEARQLLEQAVGRGVPWGQLKEWLDRCR